MSRRLRNGARSLPCYKERHKVTAQRAYRRRSAEVNLQIDFRENRRRTARRQVCNQFASFKKALRPWKGDIFPKSTFRGALRMTWHSRTLGDPSTEPGAGAESTAPIMGVPASVSVNCLRASHFGPKKFGATGTASHICGSVGRQSCPKIGKQFTSDLCSRR